MSTTSQFKTIDAPSQYGVVHHLEQAEQQDSALSAGQKISYTLQQTLDVEVIIQLFCQEVMQYVAYSGIEYQNEALALNTRIGEMAQHRCNYRLVVENEILGELTYSRRTHFTKQEVKTLEDLLCGLLFPLRNALSYQKAMSSALTDPLTGVGNRAALDVCLNREIELAKRYDIPLSLMILDIDHFKEINDQYGHRAGDDVLKRFIETINECVRRSDICFRYGGDEFVVVLSRTEPEGARLLAERIRRSIESIEFEADNDVITVTSSVGVTSLHTGDVLHTLFNRVDQALYEAKELGRNRVCLAV